MADLSGVIRLKKFQLDEKRRVLADLNALLSELLAERDRLDAQVLVEQAHAQASLEGQLAYGKFAQAAIARRKRLGDSIVQVEGQIEAATDQVREAMGELKKFEITQAEREKRARAKVRRRETQTLDDIAIERFQRKTGV
ncbi:flagellar FliJ family protein [Roseiterribacter gracilis]|uniref:Flagellar FliJ protein n=1 Tax=Roseiterribacter gracilis TaxID=2812848 RepID=A0A8S8XHF5_9PROT|nr:flagellar export protein FliJ [Rhodospirillales bacterium TMPK1]